MHVFALLFTYFGVITCNCNRPHNCDDKWCDCDFTSVEQREKEWSHFCTALRPLHQLGWLATITHLWNRCYRFDVTDSRSVLLMLPREVRNTPLLIGDGALLHYSCCSEPPVAHHDAPRPSRRESDDTREGVCIENRAGSQLCIVSFVYAFATSLTLELGCDVHIGWTVPCMISWLFPRVTTWYCLHKTIQFHNTTEWSYCFLSCVEQRSQTTLTRKQNESSATSNVRLLHLWEVLSQRMFGLPNHRCRILYKCPRCV